MSQYASMIKKAAVAVALTASVAALAGTSAGTAAAASVPFAKAHHVSVTIDYQVHKKLSGYSVNKPSTRVHSKDITKGESNDELAHKVYSESSTAINRYGRDAFYMTEKDSGGTLHVTDIQALLKRDVGGGPSVSLNLDVAPNSVRSFWIYTDDADGSWVHSLVTITNSVS